MLLQVMSVGFLFNIFKSIQLTFFSNLQGVHCGKYKNGINYCPKGQCCSKYGYCANSTTHCGDDCQILFGRCNQISSCKLAGRQNFFPTTSYFQRSLKNEDKNYWFPLCEAEQIFFDTRQPLEAVTCSEDGSRPKIKKNCGKY